MQEYQRGVMSEGTFPFGFSPMDFRPVDWGCGVTGSDRDKDAGLAILLIVLAILFLCMGAFFWVKDRVSNFMAKICHRRFNNEEVNQVIKEQVPDDIRGY